MCNIILIRNTNWYLFVWCFFFTISSNRNEIIGCCFIIFFFSAVMINTQHHHNRHKLVLRAVSQNFRHCMTHAKFYIGKEQARLILQKRFFFPFFFSSIFLKTIESIKWKKSCIVRSRRCHTCKLFWRSFRGLSREIWHLAF